MLLNDALVAATALKLLLIPTYRSTDFEVHRNWLAITHSLPIQDWYFDTTSEWTLDYPPFFAYFEWALSQVARFVDPAMLRVDNLGYASSRTIVFQRLTVIFSELVLFLALKRYKSNKIGGSHLVALSIFLSPGFLIIDHIHFQYNGFMYGILLYSLYYAAEQPILSGSLFATLLCFKHIYLYLAPAYFVYLLRKVVLTSDMRGIHFQSTVRLGFAVLAPFILAFGPFVLMGQTQQVLSRLFPFSRGLCHAYWAPNFWALYSFVDRVAIQFAPMLGLRLSKDALASGTRGLVGNTDFAWLPDVTPRATFVLTATIQLVAGIKLFRRPLYEVFIGHVTMCAYASFFFGWHVHEKAVLLIILPATLLALKDTRFLFAFTPLMQAGYMSLLPLIFTGQETPLVLAYTTAYLLFFMRAFDEKAPPPQKERFFLMDRIGRLYTAAFVPIVIFNYILHPLLLSERKSITFLPLMLMSVYCAWGILWSFLGFSVLYFTQL
ncbi:Dolichyl pyrophosphate Glc1Man9GlcNAc2 alpha-1,3-glucosyltransferase [Protomyces lactucae-debilis]|uniref:Alpha-1,3-glucosyltransferase n=1 Tax=Protomyces lactucae-debilis TaxID=2754530 RepID=A0A1Y2FQJ4_PROLT|nr:Dolichyl pyrophosphate Glc1Man9GlcNAc2 alpha-1,3-glucosyltransferase [Protomyces lactucae-debilis]ORY86250.1 Dolichyl pyrophosphate Glc1Man9GlcNAc2 alpha-1,3-glucosyltransferase [Protomyces lactucae-debilis]